MTFQISWIFYAFFPNVEYLLGTFIFCRGKAKNDEHDDVRITKVKIGMTTEVR